MIFLFLIAGGLWFLHAGVSKKQLDGTTPKNPNARPQPISSQAKQGFLQGSANCSVRYGKAGEGNRAIAGVDYPIRKGLGGAAGTDRVAADLLDRASKTFDPQWRMRYLNAYHRMSLQQDVNAGRSPQASLNVDRIVEEVGDDSGEASGFTRTQITYQDRFKRGVFAPGMGPNATRPLDQEDPGDQTSLQTPLSPNGNKSVIYPRDFSKIRHVNLERDYWSENGQPLNVGYTTQSQPRYRGWGNWLQDLFSRLFTGAHAQSVQSIPSRSNPANDSVATGA